MASWEQGQHVVIIGMNGSGKTTLARSLLNAYRTWKIMLVTKPDDLAWNGWKTTNDPRQISNRQATSWRLYPEYERSRDAFYKAMTKAWAEGGWCVYMDELYHLSHKGLEGEVIKLLTQGRSKRVTVVAGVQRPAWVTRFALSEPRHTFCFRVGDRRDAKALGDSLGKEFEREVETLAKYEYVYHDKESGKMLRGSSRDVEGIFDQ